MSRNANAANSAWRYSTGFCATISATNSTWSRATRNCWQTRRPTTTPSWSSMRSANWPGSGGVHARLTESCQRTIRWRRSILLRHCVKLSRRRKRQIATLQWPPSSRERRACGRMKKPWPWRSRARWRTRLSTRRRRWPSPLKTAPKSVLSPLLMTAPVFRRKNSWRSKPRPRRASSMGEASACGNSGGVWTTSTANSPSRRTPGQPSVLRCLTDVTRVLTDTDYSRLLPPTAVNGGGTWFSEWRRSVGEYDVRGSCWWSWWRLGAKEPEAVHRLLAVVQQPHTDMVNIAAHWLWMVLWHAECRANRMNILHIRRWLTRYSKTCFTVVSRSVPNRLSASSSRSRPLRLAGVPAIRTANVGVPSSPRHPRNRANPVSSSGTTSAFASGEFDASAGSRGRKEGFVTTVHCPSTSSYSSRAQSQSPTVASSFDTAVSERTPCVVSRSYTP